MFESRTTIKQWVDEVAQWVQPDQVVWLHGGQVEQDRLIQAMLADGTLEKLNPEKYPNCYLHRSSPGDVARVEHRTFICSREKRDAGPTNNWWNPNEAKAKVSEMFKGCMKGRTMYVIPYLMGPASSPFSQVGCEVTDSAYVAASMHIMTLVGDVALEHLKEGDEFVAGLHSIGELDPERRYILHFPEERQIWSFGSGYGGNALLGKKCHALRIASVQARSEGWMAEHMLILGLERPGKETIYIAAAFPSACGKTNLAMLKNPEFEAKGIRVWTVGDDIAWLRVGEDGRLWAVNPEAGFFGVVPGTNWHSNPNAMESIQNDTLYTNVAVSADGIPWWEGLDDHPPDDLIDWKGNPWNHEAPAAHSNSRFTAPLRNCPSLSPEYGKPQGVPISAIIFGGRRAKVAPLVYQAFDWNHGVFIGSGMASETTSAEASASGVVRRDPMAMLPFCGYNMGDYLGHWLAMGAKLQNPPAIFSVNWYRKDEEGEYLWPGYGDNLRVLLWIADQIEGTHPSGSQETPIGTLPKPDVLNLEGLDISPEVVQKLVLIDPEVWKEEIAGLKEHFDRFGDDLPEEIRRQFEALKGRFGFSE